ncbi:hypothetical protein MY972_08390, partial [Haemophilus influenzae]
MYYNGHGVKQDD